jgi:nucleoside-diphosphate-sugar epimerase
MRVLLTGAEGFTGHYLAAELKAAGHEVHGLVRHASPQVQLDSVHVADLRDADGLRAVIEQVRPDSLVHLAAIAFVAHGSVEDIYLTNVVGTRNLLQAAVDAAAPLKSLLLASSANIYGNAGGARLDEATPPQPANDYAVSKLAMEYVARLYSARLPLLVTRPFNYTGVGQSLDFLLPKIVDHFRRSAPVIELGNLDVARDFLDVRSVVAYYRRLLETPAAVGGTFNVCSGRTWSIGQVLESMRALSRQDMEVRVNPAFVRKDEVKTLCGNPGSLHSLVGIAPAIELHETLRWMLEAPDRP